jgi:hypothetical protein
VPKKGNIRMNVFVNYVLSAMMYWVPITDHAYYEDNDITLSRYTEIATTIVEVSMDPNNKPLFDEDDGRIKTALLLASVASSESSFKQKVDSCEIGGDHGLAWGLWQTHADKKQVCSSRTIAANIALEMMRTSLTKCKKYPLMDRMSIYTDGRCHTNWQRSHLKMYRLVSWYSKFKPEFEYDSMLMVLKN